VLLSFIFLGCFMKYFLASLISLPLLTACTSIQEEYYGPYDQPPPPRAEVYRYVEPGTNHGHRATQHQQGAYPAGHGRQIHGHGPSQGHAVVIHPRNQHVPVNEQGQNRVIVPQNTHGHGQGTGENQQNTHTHGQSLGVSPQNVHGHGQGVEVSPQNTHGHQQGAAASKSGSKASPRENTQISSNAHGDEY
jgi:hypothetical protein